MDLNDVLNDIQGDLAPADNQLNLPDSETSPEQTIQEVNVPSTSQDNSPHAADFEALENLKTCLVYRGALESMELVPKTLAQEIFTMLPDLSDPLLAAKLTNAASAHNKSLLLSRLDSYQPSPESLMPMFTQIYTTLCDVVTKLAEVKPVVTQVVQELETQVARTRATAVIVFCRKSYHLYDTPLSTLLTINDALIDFPPYEGRLTKTIEEFIYTTEYQQFSEGRSGEVTLADVIQYIKGWGIAFSSIEESLDSMSKKLCQYDPKLFTQVDFKRLIQHIDSANCIINSFVKDTAMTDGVLKFLRLLV